MDPEKKSTSTIRFKSPLSAFLSNLIEERFGSIRTKSVIVVDNPLSHSSILAIPSSSGIFYTASLDSVARTTSSSSLTSSRWDPNVFPSADRNIITSGSGHQGNHKNCGTHRLEPFPLLWSSSDVPIVPARRDSPEERRRKQELIVANNKSSKRILTTGSSAVMTGSSFETKDIASKSSLLRPPYPIRQVSLPSCDLFLSRSEPNLALVWKHSKVKCSFGTKDSLRPSTLLPPPYPIRQVSLSPCDLFLSRSEPNLTEDLMRSKVVKKLKNISEKKGEGDKEKVAKKKILQRNYLSSTSKKKTKKASRKFEAETKKKFSSLQSPRSPPWPPILSEPGSPSTPTKFYRCIRSSISPKKKKKNLSVQKLVLGSEEITISPRTPSPSKISVLIPPKIRKRDTNEREAVRSTGIPESFRFPIIEDGRKSERWNDSNGKKSVAVDRCHRHPLSSRRSRRLAAKPSDLEEYAISSSRSTMVLPEGRSFVSALTSLPSPVPTRSPKTASEPTRARLTRNPQLPSNQRRSSTLANHRSLSETLLSCDRDTVDPCSSALSSGSLRTNKRLNRDHKRAPPIQPIRQLSRALFEL